MLDFPNTPTIGQQFTGGTTTWVWDGTAWNIVPQMMPAMAMDTPPANPAVGQFWWRATNGQLYVYVDDGDSKQWVQAAGQAGTPGAWECIPNASGNPLHTFSAVVNYPVLNLSPFRKLRIAGIASSSVTSFLALSFSLDNGATWKTGALDYKSQSVIGTAASASAGAGTQTAFVLTTSNDTPNKGQFETVLEDFNINGICLGISRLAVVSGGNLQTGIMHGITQFNGPCTALRLVASGGNITGSFTIEGVRG